MAMTDEELLLQMNILTTATENNENMKYRANAALNKGLNPEFFTGNNTKIVNAINLLAETSVTVADLSEAVANKVNEILMDTSSNANRVIWENVKELMEMDTIIEGIQRILEGKQQDKILGITPDDIGKILSVSQAEDGEMMVKAIDNILNPGQMEYTIEEYPEVQTVENALDKLFELQNNKIDEVTWDMIMNKPAIPTGLELTSEALVMNDDDGEMSSVPLMTDEDISILINDLGI
jgi:predicted RNA binding protein with dsRBD fold (UPF0201 family)